VGIVFRNVGIHLQRYSVTSQNTAVRSSNFAVFALLGRGRRRLEYDIKTVRWNRMWVYGLAWGRIHRLAVVNTVMNLGFSVRGFNLLLKRSSVRGVGRLVVLGRCKPAGGAKQRDC
jgi:hypothetical protein